MSRSGATSISEGSALLAFDNALKIDPKYEPALKNKAILLSLKDGEKMPDNKIETVDYYKEVAKAKRASSKLQA